jgi:hypothetical protein
VRHEPEPAGAIHLGVRPDPAGGGRTAEVRGMVLVCAHRPAPTLVVGQDRAEVLLAAARLGLPAGSGERGGP